MPPIDRRRFLANTGRLEPGAAAGASLLASPARAKGVSPNEKITLGVVGIRGRGHLLAMGFALRGDCQVAYMADCDQRMFGTTASKGYMRFTPPELGRLPRIEGVEKAQGKAPKAVTDFRRVLDDKSVDAVVTGTPDHWHVLVTVWACQAGKHVYVEKPVSWNVWEGRKMVEAARKHNRIVQAGMQQRSCPLQPQIKQLLDDGTLGKILYVRLNRYGRRAPVPKSKTPLKIPDTVDYNLWLGPAKDLPLYRTKLHYDWHWVWNTGNGEMGNWGPHLIDDCRNVVFRDKADLPVRCIAGGGRLGWDDAGETPNTHFVYYDTGTVPVICDVHNLPRKAGERGSDVYRPRRTRGFLIIECEGGYYAGGRGGGAAYDKDGKKIKKLSGDGGRGHIPNFIQAVRSGKPEDLEADIEKGHLSSAWCHVGNLSWQVGRPYRKEEALERVKGYKPWADVLDQFHAHLEANEIDASKADIKLGSMLEIDPKAEALTGPSATPEAKALWTGHARGYRKPFVIPETI